MAKISKKKSKTSKAKTAHKRKTKHKKTKEVKTEKALIANFIALQKIMVNFSAKFDNLSNQISKLLELFEISAKSLAKKDFERDRENKERKAVIEKLDNISQQAGLIGKGLALIRDINSEKEQQIMPQQMPQRPPIPPRKPTQGMAGYQKSISLRDSEHRPTRP